MYHSFSSLWIDPLRKGLEEDGQPWDWTTLGLNSAKCEAEIFAKSEGVWAAETLMHSLEPFFPGLEVQNLLGDGKKFKKGDLLTRFRGPASMLLALERPVLNLAAYVSGIATATRKMVDQVEAVCPEHSPRVTLTRKTLPGFRDLCILGVRVGGGYPHRVSLSGGVLIKENHIAVAGGLSSAVAAVRSVAPHGLRVEVEVRDLEELTQALACRVDAVLLDNFSPDEVREALEIIQKQSLPVRVEVSGGLSLATITQYALPGVHVLSVGALTHSVQNVDLTFLTKI